jgi:hypothetical protein
MGSLNGPPGFRQMFNDTRKQVKSQAAFGLADLTGSVFLVIPASLYRFSSFLPTLFPPIFCGIPEGYTKR